MRRDAILPTILLLCLVVSGSTLGDTDGSATTTEADETSTSTVDEPGCDMFPDTVCTTKCCAVHDECYHLNGCVFGGPRPAGAPCTLCDQAVGSCVYACFEGTNPPCEGTLCGCERHTCYTRKCEGVYFCSYPDEGGCDAEYPNVPECEEEGTNWIWETCECEGPSPV